MSLICGVYIHRVSAGLAGERDRNRFLAAPAGQSPSVTACSARTAPAHCRAEIAPMAPLSYGWPPGLLWPP